eukprot:scaffold800_cov111-Isochrysis_galbana.AAC.3
MWRAETSLRHCFGSGLLCSGGRVPACMGVGMARGIAIGGSGRGSSTVWFSSSSSAKWQTAMKPQPETITSSRCDLRCSSFLGVGSMPCFTRTRAARPRAAAHNLAQHRSDPFPREDPRRRHPNPHLPRLRHVGTPLVRTEEAAALRLGPLALDKWGAEAGLDKDVRVRRPAVGHRVVALRKPAKLARAPCLQLVHDLGARTQVVVVFGLGASASGQQVPGRDSREATCAGTARAARRQLDARKLGSCARRGGRGDRAAGQEERARQGSEGSALVRRGTRTLLHIPLSPRPAALSPVIADAVRHAGVEDWWLMRGPGASVTRLQTKPNNLFLVIVSILDRKNLRGGRTIYFLYLYSILLCLVYLPIYAST